MKNTVQKYCFLTNPPNIFQRNMQYNSLFVKNVKPELQKLRKKANNLCIQQKNTTFAPTFKL